jgi:hypothetical protein
MRIDYFHIYIFIKHRHTYFYKIQSNRSEESLLIY